MGLMKQLKCILLNYKAAAGKLVGHEVLCDSLRVSDNGWLIFTMISNIIAWSIFYRHNIATEAAASISVLKLNDCH
jgi:hypothetical protein